MSVPMLIGFVTGESARLVALARSWPCTLTGDPDTYMADDRVFANV